MVGADYDDFLQQRETGMSSWKTTTTGILAIVVAISAAVKCTIDNDPSTVADWGSVAAAVMAGIGLIFARDNKTTSEQAGAGV